MPQVLIPIIQVVGTALTGAAIPFATASVIASAAPMLSTLIVQPTP
ncbi:MAG: hypothetical protein WKG52_01065 [Variovorax sp.]